MPTTIKEAVTKWEEKTGQKAVESVRIDIFGQLPPIEKMDATLSTLTKCERLSLSTNCIEKITNLHGLKNLKILSLSRNNIKTLAGLEACADTLEQLWISYNIIEKMKGINLLKKLKVLYFSYNIVKEWGEFMKVNELPVLDELVFIGNPLWDKHTADGDWTTLVAKKVPNLQKLDGYTVIREGEGE